MAEWRHFNGLSRDTSELYIINSFRTHAIQGISVSGDDVAQERSLASMRVRYAAQSESALLLAWLKQQPEFVQVLHPAEPSAAGHSY